MKTIKRSPSEHTRSVYGSIRLKRVKALSKDPPWKTGTWLKALVKPTKCKSTIKNQSWEGGKDIY